MEKSTYIEMEDDVREDICVRQPSAPKKEKRRVEDVQPAPKEEKVTPGMKENVEVIDYGNKL